MAESASEKSAPLSGMSPIPEVIPAEALREITPRKQDMADNNAELAEILKLLKELKNDVTAVKAMLTDGGDITMQRDADGNFISYKLKPHVNDNGVNGEDEPHGV
jgi:hypothetical protein